jgi:hypothetical protein
VAGKKQAKTFYEKAQNWFCPKKKNVLNFAFLKHFEKKIILLSPHFSSTYFSAMCEPKVLKSGGKKTGKDILQKSPKLVLSFKKMF